MVGEKIGTTNALVAVIRTNNHFRFDHTYLGISDFVTSALSQVQLVALDSRRCSITENDWRECVISAMETLRNSSNSPSRNLYDSPSRNTRNSPSRNSHKSPSHNSRKSPTLYPNCPCDHCLRQGECTDESSGRVVNGSNSGDHDLDDCKHKLEKSDGDNPAIETSAQLEKSPSAIDKYKRIYQPKSAPELLHGVEGYDLDLSLTHLWTLSISRPASLSKLSLIAIDQMMGEWDGFSVSVRERFREATSGNLHMDLKKLELILLTDEGKIPKKANRSGGGGGGGGDLDWTEVVRRAMNKQIVEELWE